MGGDMSNWDKDVLSTSITNSFLAHAMDNPDQPLFVVQQVNADGKPIPQLPLTLTPTMQKMVEIIAEGIANYELVWQGQVTVTGTDTISGNPISGGPSNSFGPGLI